MFDKLSARFVKRTDDALIHLLHPLLGCEWYRGYATHTAGVQTGIVLALRLNLMRMQSRASHWFFMTWKQSMTIEALGKTCVTMEYMESECPSV